MASLVGASALGGPAPVPRAQVLQERQEMLAALLLEDRAERIAKARRVCAAGNDPKALERARNFGSYALPDSADSCITVLLSTGRKGALLEFYQQLARDLSGQPDQSGQIPIAIGSAVLRRGESVVALGDGHGAVITPALALDAGFTVAFLKSERYTQGMPHAAMLKPIAERCLAQAERDLSLCYSTGYAYGVLAVSGLPVTAVSAGQ